MRLPFCDFVCFISLSFSELQMSSADAASGDLVVEELSGVHTRKDGTLFVIISCKSKIHSCSG